MKSKIRLFITLSMILSSISIKAQCPQQAQEPTECCSEVQDCCQNKAPCTPQLKTVRAYRSGQQAGVNGCAIAAGIGIIVAIAAVAVISNNSHSH